MKKIYISVVVIGVWMLPVWGMQELRVNNNDLECTVSGHNQTMKNVNGLNIRTTKDSLIINDTPYNYDGRSEQRIQRIDGIIYINGRKANPQPSMNLQNNPSRYVHEAIIAHHSSGYVESIRNVLYACWHKAYSLVSGRSSNTPSQEQQQVKPNVETEVISSSFSLNWNKLSGGIRSFASRLWVWQYLSRWRRQEANMEQDSPAYRSTSTNANTQLQVNTSNNVQITGGSSSQQPEQQTYSLDDYASHLNNPGTSQTNTTPIYPAVEQAQILNNNIQVTYPAPSAPPMETRNDQQQMQPVVSVVKEPASEKKQWVIKKAQVTSNGSLTITFDSDKKEGLFLRKPTSSTYTHASYDSIKLNLPGVNEVETTSFGSIMLQGIGAETLERAILNGVDLTLICKSNGNILVNESWRLGKCSTPRYLRDLNIISKSFGNCKASKIYANNVNVKLLSNGNAYVTPLKQLTGNTRGFGTVHCNALQEDLETDFEGNIKFLQ